MISTLPEYPCDSSESHTSASDLNTPASSSESVNPMSPCKGLMNSPSSFPKNPISDIPFSIGGPAHSQAIAALMQRIVCEGCE